MFDNVAVNVCIGLIFVILLYSLLATIVQEIIAKWFGLRARVLARGIKRMLEDNSEVELIIKAAPRWAQFFIERTTLIGFVINLLVKIKSFFVPLNPNSFSRKFYDHPSIKYLGENQWFSKPSYISPSNFSSTIIFLLRGDDFDSSIPEIEAIKTTLISNKLFIDKDTLYYLKALLVDSSYDLEKFRKALEKWFSETMERTTGWYKRKVQFILFVIGLALATAFNLDIIALAKILSKDKSARQELAGLNNLSSISTSDMQQLSSEDSLHRKSILEYVDSSVIKTFNTSTNDIFESQHILGLGHKMEASCDSSCMEEIKWAFEDFKSGRITFMEYQDQVDRIVHWKSNLYSSGLKRWAGIIISALAISLGAPFWFDLLNKFMLLRGTVKKSAKKNTMTKVDVHNG
jgi:hypothetical protein